MRVGSQVARKEKMGTVVGIFHAFTFADPQPPGDWPEPTKMAIVQWPGRKKLTVEPPDSLLAPEDF